MSMLAGVTLVASTLLGASPASAAPVAPTAPAEFGTDWHDPLTAAPPVAKPDTRSCDVTVAEAQFRDFTPYKGSYTPPTRLRRPLEQGRPAPRRQGQGAAVRPSRLSAHRRRRGLPYVHSAALARRHRVVRREGRHALQRHPRAADQPVEMLIGNVVDDTYTGVIDVKVTLTFYAAERHRQAGRGRRPPTASSPSRTAPSPPRATVSASSPRCTPPGPAAAARSTGI